MSTLSVDGQQLLDEALEAFRAENQKASMAAAEAALALALASDETALEVEALVALSRVALRELDFPKVAQLCERAQEAAERTGSRAALVMPLHMRAEATRLRGDLAAARPLYEQSLAVNNDLGDERMVCVELHNLAYVDLGDGDLDTAEQRFGQSLTMTQQLTGGMRIPCLLGLGAVAAARGDGTRAGLLIAAGEAAMRAAGQVVDPADAPELRRSTDRARAALGADADRVWTEGAALTLDDAVALAEA